MTPRPIPELAAAAREVLSALDDAGIRACVIGALAVHRWGEPRATSDADLSALAPYGDEEDVLERLLQRFETRRPDARDFALANRVLLLKTQDGVEVDVALRIFIRDRSARYGLLVGDRSGGVVTHMSGRAPGGVQARGGSHS